MSSQPRVLITGATGGLGFAVVEHLIAHGADPSRIAALVRDPGKAAELAKLSVDIRYGDYADATAMRAALSGVDRLLLISATAFSDAAGLHADVISAAKAAGVRHIVYTAIENEAQADGFVIEQVTAWDRATEQALAASGLGVTIARHSLYVDSLPFIIGDQVQHGVIRAPAGEGRAAVVLRDDLAEAHARLILLDNPEPEYVLTGAQALSMREIVASIGEGIGQPVTYEPVPIQTYVDIRGEEGLPEPVARFMGGWFEGFRAGAFPAHGDIARLLGRSPRSALAWLESHYRSSETEDAAHQRAS